MIYLRLFLSFCKVGLLGFGGGLAIVRLIYDSIQPFLDISREMFANIVAISQITPGPLAVNTATYVGYEAAGILGSACATLGVIIPEFIIVSIVARMIHKFKDSNFVRGAMTGIRPAVMGLIGAAVVTLIVPSLAGESRLGAGLFTKLGADMTQGLIGQMMSCPVDIIAVLITAATVLLVAKFKKSPFVILIVMGCLGAVLGA